MQYFTKMCTYYALYNIFLSALKCNQKYYCIFLTTMKIQMDGRLSLSIAIKGSVPIWTVQECILPKPNVFWSCSLFLKKIP